LIEVIPDSLFQPINVLEFQRLFDLHAGSDAHFLCFEKELHQLCIPSWPQ